MSSYEDVYGMATSIIEALKNIQWKSPIEWELESIIEPISEQIILKLSKSQNLAANPTLAAPTNIRLFLNNIQTSIEDPTQLFIFIAFLIFVPLLSTIFVAMLTNINIVLKVLGLPLARNPVKASPLTVILLMVTIFGNIPLVSFFPERAAQVQASLQIQPGHYNGVIAQVLQIVAVYEQIELGVRVFLELSMFVRYRHIQIARLLRPASIVAWLLTFTGFALRMWFTRVSTDTATSPIQSGSTIRIWRDATLRTDVSYQSKAEFDDDVFIWVTYFVITFGVSSLFTKYALAPRHEAYQPVEPTIIKLTASSSIQTANVGCQTIVSGEDWVTKSSIATDAGRIDRIQSVINSDMKRTSDFSRDWCHAAYFAAEDLKDLTLIWQNDHTALQTHVSLLRSFRIVVERHREEARKQRQFAENVSTNVIRLEETLSEKEREYEEKLKLRETEYQARIKELLLNLDLEKGTDSTLDDSNKQEASQPDASLGPREAESHSVSANTPELQNVPETSVTDQCAPKSDSKSSTDPTSPSPPSSAGDSISQSVNSHEDKKSESVTEKASAPATDLASSDCTPAPLVAAVSPTTESGVEPEKASDSEMDAANASGGSDDEFMEEIGTGIWSRVQKFEFRSEQLTVQKKKLIRQHFTVQEIQDITALLIDFRDNIANDTQHEQVSNLLNGGFPYRMGLKYARNLDYVSVFLDLAELNKKPTQARIFTDIPPMAFAYTCGIHPQNISMISGPGKTWRTYRQRALVPYADHMIDSLDGEDKVFVQENKTRILGNLERFLGGRSEHWNRAVPVQALKADQAWDINLIARRLLENFGLLEFRMGSTEGTSMEEYIPPALLEPAPIRPRINETSVETPSAEVSTTVTASETLSVEIPPTELPATVPANSDASSINVPITVPACSENPSLEVPSEEVPATVSTCSETLVIDAPPKAPAAVSMLGETSSIEMSPAELAITVPPCSQSPSVEAPSAESSAILPTCNDPTPSEPLAIAMPDEPVQPTPTEASPQSTPEATPVPSDSFMAPCVESSPQVLPPASQVQPSLASTASSSTVTPTRATPSKFTAPDWRQEALQDMALRQQTQQPQRPILPLPQSNGRKSRGGRGRPKHSNA